MKTLSTFIIFIFSLTAFAQDYYFEEGTVAFEDRHHLTALPADGDLNDLVFKYRVLIKADATNVQEVLGIIYPTMAGAADNLALLLNDEYIDGFSEGAATPTVFGPDDGFIYFNGGQKAFLQDSIGGQSNKSVLFSQLSEMFNDNNGGPCPKTSFINSENSGECGGNLVGFSLKGLTNVEFPFAPEKFFKLYNISTNTFIDYRDETFGTMVAAFPFDTSVAKERVLWFDALVGDTSGEVSGRCNGGKKASQEKCSQAGHNWQPMDMKNCRPQLNGTFSSSDCLESVRNWFVTKNNNSIASSMPNAKNISLVDFDNFCIDVADTVQPLVWNGTPLQGFSESPATTQISLFESYFNEGDHTTLLGLREIDNIVKPSCGNTSPPPSPNPPAPSGSCGGPMVTTWDFSDHPDSQPTLTLPITRVFSRNYNATIDWGDGTSSQVTSYNDPKISHTYSSRGNFTITISGDLFDWGHDFGSPNEEWREYITKVENLGDLSWLNLKFSSTPKLTEFSGGVTTNLISMSEMFFRAGAAFNNWEVIHNHILNLDTSCFDTSNVKDMGQMFSGTKPASLILTHFDTSSVTDMGSMFSGIKSLTDATFDISTFDTSSVTNMRSMFSQFYGVSTLNLSHFDTSQVTDMSYMFDGGECSSSMPLEVYLQNGDNCGAVENPPTSIILANWNTQNVEKMHLMFYDSGVTTLDLSSFNTSKVTDMYGMFGEARVLTSLDLSNFDTQNVTYMGSMFSNTNSLSSLNFSSSFDTSKVTDMSGMFEYTSSLSSLDLSSFDTSNVIDMSKMFLFSNLENINILNFDTSNVENMKHMFSHLENIQSGTINLSNFNTQKVTNMNSMFMQSNTITSLNLNSFDTSNVTDMSRMFSDCTLLQSIDLSLFDTSSVTTMSSMFRDIDNFQNLDLSSFDTINVLDMGSMFNDFKTNDPLDLSGFDTSSVTGMISMFSGAQLLGGLNISSFDTSSVTSTWGMFSEFKSDGSVLDLKHFDTSQVTNMTQMFSWMSVPLDISTFNTSNVTYMGNMFKGYNNNLGVNVSSFDTSSVTSMNSMFANYTSLQPLDLSNFTTNQVTSFYSTFGSLSVPSLNLNGWNVSGFVEPSPNQYMHPYGLDGTSNFMTIFNGTSKILYCDQPGGILWGQACTTGP